MSSHDIVTLSAVASHVASNHKCEVPGDSPGHAHDCLVWRLPRARCRQWLGTLLPVTGAKSQVIHLGMLMIVLCGDCVVRVVGSDLRRFVQSHVRSPR